MKIFLNTLRISLITSYIIASSTPTATIIEQFGCHSHRHLTIEQRSLIIRTIETYNHCKLLVIGTGLDSELWMNINKNGITHFLEHNEFWIEQSKKKFPAINIIKIEYNTTQPEWERLLASSDYNEFLPKTTPNIDSNEYDIIIVDGPESYPTMPDCIPNIGRMQAFFLAHKLFFNAKNTLHLFIHDSDRIVEKTYAETLFGTMHLVAEQDNLLYYKTTHQTLS